MRAPTVAFTSLFCLALLTASLEAQRPAPGAPSPNSPIALDVVVTNAAGQPARGLQTADFEIREDGKPVPIEGVTPVDLNGGGAAGRTYLIAIDSLHLSSKGAVHVAPLVQRFVNEDLGPRDRAAVLTLGPTPAITPLTNDAQLLAHAATAAGQRARDFTLAHQSPLEFGVGAVTRAAMTDATISGFAALTRVIDGLGHEPGMRVAVLFVSEGVSIEGSDTRDTIAVRHALFAAAARKNVSIYPINPVGMATINSSLEPSAEYEPAGLSAWDSLRTLANETGGRAILDSAKLTAPYRQIVQDTSTYYILTYQSPHAGEHDGDFHEVRVTVKQKGLTIRARKGWYEPGV